MNTLNKATEEISKGFWKSVGITFLATFLVSMLPALNSSELTWQMIEAGALAGALFTAFRLAVKAVIEFLIAHFSK